MSSFEKFDSKDRDIIPFDKGVVEDRRLPGHSTPRTSYRDESRTILVNGRYYFEELPKKIIPKFDLSLLPLINKKPGNLPEYLEKIPYPDDKFTIDPAKLESITEILLREFMSKDFEPYETNAKVLPNYTDKSNPEQ